MKPCNSNACQPFILVLLSLVFLLSACAPGQNAVAAPTQTAVAMPNPEQEYAQEMKSAMDSLKEFIVRSGEFDKAMQEHADVIAFCRGKASVITEPCEFDQASAVLNLTDEVMNSVFEAKSSLEAVTPLPVLRTSHTEIAKCIDLEVGHAKYVRDFNQGWHIGRDQRGY